MKGESSAGGKDTPRGEKGIPGGGLWRAASEEGQAWERGRGREAGASSIGGGEGALGVVEGEVPFCVILAFSADSAPLSPCRLGLSTLVSGVITQAFSLCLTLTRLVPTLRLQTGSSPSLDGPTPTAGTPYGFLFSSPFKAQISPPQKPSSFTSSKRTHSLPRPSTLSYLSSWDPSLLKSYYLVVCWFTARFPLLGISTISVIFFFFLPLCAELH